MARNQAALSRFLRERMRTPFGWTPPGQDCCDFTFGAVLAQTGVDHWAAERGRYSTELGAARVLARRGGVKGICDSLLRPVTPSLAQRGDVGLMKGRQTPDGPILDTLCVIEGDFLWVLHIDGLRPLERRHLELAWSAD